MTKEEKQQLIVQAIQTDSTLIALLKLSVANNIVNIEEPRLDVLIAALGLTNG